MKAVKYVIGKSVRGEPIERFVFSNPSSRTHILCLAGVHGDEGEGVALIHKFQEFVTHQKHIPCNVHIIPCVNPDGYKSNTRVNANGVDLNRNLPTKDWSAKPKPGGECLEPPHNREELLRYNPGEKPGSEPENKALMTVIQERIWKGIISLHSYEIPMVNYNDAHSEPMAKLISKAVDLPAKADIGYPTPGSLGTWVGFELKIPCVTVEIPKGMAFFGEWDPFVQALWQVVEKHESW